MMPHRIAKSRAGVLTMIHGLMAWLVVLCVAGMVQAQTPSLADLAKKEQDRRKKVPPPQKVYTNKDLPAPATPPAASPTPTPDAAPSFATPDLKPPAEAKEQTESRTPGDTRDEAWWRTRMTAAREELRRNEVFLDALQSRVNSLSADFVNRDDPFQRAKIGEDRQKALAEMDRVKRDIEQGKKMIEEIEEEARKAGVPPGWLR